MANICNDLENKLINATLRNTAYTSTATTCVGLFTDTQDATGDSNAEANTLTEVTGGSYARTAIAFNAPSNGATDNTLCTFPTATANWGTINYVIIYDATAGNPMYWSRLTTPKTVNNGDTFKFAAGDLDVSLA